MGVDLAQNREGITVHTASPVHRGGLVFYASLPSDTNSRKEHGTSEQETKHRLVSILWDHLVAVNSYRGACPELVAQPPSAVDPSAMDLPLQVTHDPLGKPHLLVGAHPGPAISFSEGGGIVWAALCGDESDVGIDVAEAAEFQGEYPCHRVFNVEELQHALNLAVGDLEKASALLWSIKEAVVKALGCGFHLVDPLEIHVNPPVRGDCEGGNGGYTFSVRLSGKALARFPMGAGQSLWVRSFPRLKMCLSIAILKRHNDTARGAGMPSAWPNLAATRSMPHWQFLPNQADSLSRQKGGPE